MGHSPVDFRIYLFIYKLDSQNNNYIYKIKKHRFFSLLPLKKKISLHTRSACDEASLNKIITNLFMEVIC